MDNQQIKERLLRGDMFRINKDYRMYHVYVSSNETWIKYRQGNLGTSRVLGSLRLCGDFGKADLLILGQPVTILFTYSEVKFLDGGF